MNSQQHHFGAEYNPQLSAENIGFSAPGTVLPRFRINGPDAPTRKRKKKESTEPRKKKGFNERLSTFRASEPPPGEPPASGSSSRGAADSHSWNGAGTGATLTGTTLQFNWVAVTPFQQYDSVPGSTSCSPPPSHPSTGFQTPSDVLKRQISLPDISQLHCSLPEPQTPCPTPIETDFSDTSHSFDFTPYFSSYTNEDSISMSPIDDSPFIVPRKRSERRKKADIIKEALARLTDDNICLNDILDQVLDPTNLGLSDVRNRFLEERNHNRLFATLSIIRDHRQTAEAFEAWATGPAIELVSRRVFDEMEAAKPQLRMQTSDVTAEFVENWNIEEIMRPVARDVTPTLHHILTVAASPKYRPYGLGIPENEDDEDPEEPEEHAEENEGRDRRLACLIIESQLHYLHSHRSCKVQVALGVYAWSTGCSQQLASLLHQAGLARCYASNMSTVEMLGERGLERARKIAAGPHILTYDNVNISTSIFVEQTESTRPKVQSGTFPVIYKPPDGITEEDVLVEPILERRRAAPDLQITDLRPSPDALKCYKHQSAINVILVLVKHYPDSFSRLSDHPVLKHIVCRRLPDGHINEYYPLPLIPVEECSTKGNLIMQETIYCKLLKVPRPLLDKRSIPCPTDQLTNSRFRTCKEFRLDDIGPWNRRQVFEPVPAMFHMLLNLVWILKEIHYGTIHENASLAQLFSLLDKTRLSGSKPDYYTLLTALQQILEGLLLDAWDVECGYGSLEAFAQSNPSPEQLLELAHRIVRNHATPSKSFPPSYVPRKSGSGQSTQSSTSAESTNGDTVRENIIRLTRNLLLLFELVSAVQDGDFGRVEDVLPDLAFIFRGAGLNNYATEILHLIHNFKYVWSKKYGDMIRDIEIINISGIPGHCMGIDLNIEHLIQYLKALFVAKGIYSNWERCGHISASINIILALKRQVSKSLKLRYQGSKHSKADSSVLVKRLYEKAKELRLHVNVPGRADASEKPDLRALGYQRMETSLVAFNAKLKNISMGVKDTGDDAEVDEIAPPDLGSSADLVADLSLF